MWRWQSCRLTVTAATNRFGYNPHPCLLCRVRNYHFREQSRESDIPFLLIAYSSLLKPFLHMVITASKNHLEGSLRVGGTIRNGKTENRKKLMTPKQYLEPKTGSKNRGIYPLPHAPHSPPSQASVAAAACLQPWQVRTAATCSHSAPHVDVPQQRLQLQLPDDVVGACLVQR